MSLVSVIIPTHNRATLLAEAIDSVLQQTFSDFELIIVDDGSTDNTPQVVAAYDDPRIVYIRQDGQERGAARNRGVAAAQGEFITFLDDDDWFLPHKLAVQVPYLQANPEVGMVISGWDRVTEDGAVVRAERPWLHHPEPVLRNWLFAAMCHVAAMLMRRSWFERVGGFNQEIISGEDTYLWYCLARAGCPTGWVPEVVFRQRLHGSNSVRNINNIRQGKTKMLEAVFADEQAPALLGISREKATGRVHLGLACMGYGSGLVEQAAADLAEAVRLDPSLLEDGANGLLEAVAAYAWNHLTDEPLPFTERVFDNLPPSLQHLQGMRRKAIARTWMVGAFRAYQQQDMAQVRQHSLRALAARPDSLRNRGLLAMLLLSFRGAKRPEGE